ERWRFSDHTSWPLDAVESTRGIFVSQKKSGSGALSSREPLLQFKNPVPPAVRTSSTILTHLLRQSLHVDAFEVQRAVFFRDFFGNLAEFQDHYTVRFLL